MASSNAPTVEDYLAELPEDRRAVVSAVRDVILENLPEGYEESMNWGMIAYEVPLDRYPITYNKQPLGYAALAAQKHYYALYLFGTYTDPAQVDELREAFARAGKKMDMGKSCLRFKRLDDLPLDAVGAVIVSTPPEALIAQYEAGRQRT